MIHNSSVAKDSVDPFLRRLAACIRQRRTSLGLTQEHVAHEAGMSVRHYFGIDRGLAKNPTLNSIRRIARALGVEVSDLLREVEAPRRRS